MNFPRMVAALGLVMAASAAQASTVNFQDLTPGNCAYYGNGPVNSGGFQFTGNPADSALFGCSAGLIGGNTSNALINANKHSIINMTQVGGGSFSLQSFFAGNRTDVPSYYGVSTGLSILGTLVGGGTVSTTVSFSGNAFSQFFLSSSFDNLLSVKFTALGTAGNADPAGPEFLIDDIVVNQATAVPEPGTLALLAIGLTGIGFGRRRKA